MIETIYTTLKDTDCEGIMPSEGVKGQQDVSHRRDRSGK